MRPGEGYSSSSSRVPWCWMRSGSPLEPSGEEEPSGELGPQGMTPGDKRRGQISTGRAQHLAVLPVAMTPLLSSVTLCPVLAHSCLQSRYLSLFSFSPLSRKCFVLTLLMVALVPFWSCVCVCACAHEPMCACVCSYVFM